LDLPFLAQTSFVTSVGIAIYTVAVVTGQTVSGFVVDRIGLGPGGKRAVTALRVLAVILTVGAVFWAVSPRISGSPDPVAMLIPLALVVLAGVLVTFSARGEQQNRRAGPVPDTGDSDQLWRRQCCAGGDLDCQIGPRRSVAHFAG
jgi:transporter family-2 protein